MDNAGFADRRSAGRAWKLPAGSGPESLRPPSVDDRAAAFRQLTRSPVALGAGVRGAPL